MEIITLSKSPTSINLFPPLYENDETVFYHGTSEIYSTQIEKFGLFPNHKPLTSFFYSILCIGRKIYEFTKGKNEYLKFNDAFTNSEDYFDYFKRLSFSPSSYLATVYATNLPGGQGLKHLKELKKELTNLNFDMLDKELNLISQVQKDYFENIDKEYQKIENSAGVVYACKLESNDKIHLSYDMHGKYGVLLSSNHIHPSKIIAKLIIGIGRDPNFLDNELLHEGHSKTKKLCDENTTTPFLRDIIIANLRNKSILKPTY